MFERARPVVADGFLAGHRDGQLQDVLARLQGLDKVYVGPGNPGKLQGLGGLPVGHDGQPIPHAVGRGLLEYAHTRAHTTHLSTGTWKLADAPPL